VNSEETYSFLEPIMNWLHLWRMPLLFLVSGVGTYYAIGKRTTRQYLKERFTRLYIPFAIGFFTLVPIMVYIERIENYDSFIQYIPHMFDGGPYPVGNISWHHLWFILYLFLISLFISPFLRFTKTAQYKRVRVRIISAVSKRLGLNWILIPIILSQAILRQYFPDSTHALYNDWAYFVYYVIFFISGFMLFTSDRLIKALSDQRRWYLLQTLIFTFIMFSFWIIDYNTSIDEELYSITKMTLGWSCGLTAIGYFKRYFNYNNKSRKILNEAIYPFYLLHQPALVLVGYIVLQWEVSTELKVVLITMLSLTLCFVCYWFVIKRINVLRLAFGMRWIKRKKEQEVVNEMVPAE
jgi:peptidoglycan/LPS O-acetylase OafA/YrhL